MWPRKQDSFLHKSKKLELDLELFFHVVHPPADCLPKVKAVKAATGHGLGVEC